MMFLSINLKKIQRSLAVFAVFFTGGTLGYGTGAYQQPVPTTQETTIHVRFSPKGQCTQFINETLAEARQCVMVQAYSFTSLLIADALIAAHKRGVQVKVLVDRSQLQAKHSQIHRLIEQGIPVAVDRVRGIAHNKVMIIDDQYVLTGSFNWTKAAELRNAENLLLIKDKKLNGIYAAEWRKRAIKAQVVEPGSKKSS